MTDFTVVPTTTLAPRDEMPTIGPIDAVSIFMLIGEQTSGTFNPQQASLYIGLMCEELRETLEAVCAGAVDVSLLTDVYAAVGALEKVSRRFKAGLHMGDIMRAPRAALLDGMLDTAWVSFGAAHSISPDVTGAWNEVGRANFDKYPDGVVIRDADGKIQKPAGFKPADLTPFVKVSDDATR